jgi:hypothetical protein
MRYKCHQKHEYSALLIVESNYMYLDIILYLTLHFWIRHCIFECKQYMRLHMWHSYQSGNRLYLIQTVLCKYLPKYSCLWCAIWSPWDSSCLIMSSVNCAFFQVLKKQNVDSCSNFVVNIKKQKENVSKGTEIPHFLVLLNLKLSPV